MGRSGTFASHTLVHTLALALASSAAFGCSSSRVECQPVDDGNPCTEDVCADGLPVSEPAAAGTSCGGAVCDGAGACVGCLETSDCADGLVCSASLECVAPTCADGILNGEETDEDCGGPTCPACAQGDRCELPSDCEDGVCEDGVCAAAACGDGVINGAEACDDGNTTGGDGCSAACVAEACGDGTVDDGEACDDGNTTDGDGCTASCVVELCGDGIVNDGGAEECDDGNTTDGDGCTASCVVETCGDGFANNGGAEECDDGNTTDGDGCSAICVVEFCGDGVVNNGGNEECDAGGATVGCNSGCELDADGDELSDTWDPFPTDPTLPGVALPNLVYAHTSSRLYTVSATDYAVTEVAPFTFDQSPGQVTDIAINRRGVVFAITFYDLFVCNPASAACYYLADLPQSFNGLTMVPPGTLHPSEDTLVGIANSGTWYAISVMGTTAMLTEIGAYGGGQQNAGDVVSIQDVGTYGAVIRPSESAGNVIVMCDPLTGAAVSDIVVTTGYHRIYGIAATADRVFAFEEDGSILEIDPAAGTFTVVAEPGLSWWGAGARTILD